MISQIPYHEVSQYLNNINGGGGVTTGGSVNQSKFDDDGEAGSTSTDGMLYEMGMQPRDMHEEMRKNPSTLIDSMQH